MSLEIGRSSAIDDDDCSFNPPYYMNERLSEPDGIHQSEDSPTATTLLTNVVACVSRILRALKSSPVASSSLQDLDVQIQECMSKFPRHHHIHSNESLQLNTVMPVIYLQNARLLLHRQNLAPMCTPDVRSHAIDDCLKISQDTARLVIRMMPEESDMSNLSVSPTRQEATLKSAASAFLCTHIWRCTLFLSFRGDYQAAFHCIKASAAIGNSRVINLSCGRYLEFFLNALLAALQQDQDHGLDQDPDLVAYLSGDLQHSFDSAWIWQRDEVDSPRSELEGNQKISASLRGIYGAVEWNGWDDIFKLLTRLSEENRQRQRGQSQGRPSPIDRDSNFRSRLESSNTVVSPGGSTRISIADIM